MKNLKKHFKGFTLVELIIVITILAILATIGFISLQGYVSNARDWNRVANITNIEKWLTLFELKTWTYPEPDNYYDWIIHTWWLSLSWEIIVYSKLWTVWEWVSRMIKLSNKALDPLSETEYTYATTQDNTKYQISSVLENEMVYNPVIQKAYANAWYNARVSWNHDINVKYPKDDKIWLTTVPSMIFNPENWNILNSSWTYLIVNKWPNLPYKINNKTIQNNKNWDEIMKIVKNNTQAKLITVDITDIVKSNSWQMLSEIEKIFWTTGWKTKEESQILLASFWAIEWETPKIEVIESIITGKASIIINSNTTNNWGINLWWGISYSNWFYKTITNDWIIYNVSNLNEWTKQWIYTSTNPSYTIKEQFVITYSGSEIENITSNGNFEWIYNISVTLLNETTANQIKYKLPEKTIEINGEIYNLENPLVNGINIATHSTNHSKIEVNFDATTKSIISINVSCVSNYVNDNGSCVEDTCNWNAPQYSTVTWAQKFNTNWTHGTTWFCTFVCQTWYYYNNTSCIPAGTGYFVASEWQTTQTVCSNKPANSTYTISSALTTNTCPWECESNYGQSWSSCLLRPATPTVSSATSITSTSITWNWQTVANATKYEFSLDNTNWINNTTNLNRVENSWISCGTSYTRYVRACNNDVCSNSATMTATSGSCYTYSWQYWTYGSCSVSSPTLSGWSSCSVTCWWWTQTRSCSTAWWTQTRTAVCKRSDGVTVDNSFCGTPTTSQSCSVTCSWYSTSQSCNTQSCSWIWTDFGSWGPTCISTTDWSSYWTTTNKLWQACLPKGQWKYFSTNCVAAWTSWRNCASWNANNLHCNTLTQHYCQ